MSKKKESGSDREPVKPTEADVLTQQLAFQGIKVYQPEGDPNGWKVREQTSGTVVGYFATRNDALAHALKLYHGELPTNMGKIADESCGNLCLK